MARNFVLRDVTCVVCGATFQAKRRDAKKCSDACAVEYKRAYDFARYAERRDDIYARVQAWYKTNKEYKSMYDAQYRADNADRIRETKRAYNQEYSQRPSTKAKVKRNSQRRRSRLAGNGTYDVTPRDLSRLVGRYRGKCAYCGDRRAEHLDHVIPVARGGSHSIGNLLPACAPCNLSKNHRYVMEWRVRKIVRRKEVY